MNGKKLHYNVLLSDLFACVNGARNSISTIKPEEKAELMADEQTLLHCYGVLTELERKDLLDYLKFKT